MKRLFLMCIINVLMSAHEQDFKRLKVVPVASLQRIDSSITYQKCYDSFDYEFEPFPLSKWPEFQPHTGTFAETFILTIPNGKVFSSLGCVLVDDAYVMQELLPQTYQTKKQLGLMHKIEFSKYKKVAGRVAVITRSNSDCYAHWLRDILGRLALLELYGVEYDWLYVPMSKRFMKETLELFGVDLKKVIEPKDDFVGILADELIVPSMINRRSSIDVDAFDNFMSMAAYYPSWFIAYMRQKFIPLMEKYTQPHQYCDKIFISRKTASYRKMLNEDEVFAEFEALGFVRYDLAELSFLEQVRLVHDAKIIVAAHGSGLTNLMFATPGAQVVEIFQQRGDCGFYYLSQMMGLKHECVKTVEFDDRGHTSSVAPLFVIRDFIASHKNLFNAVVAC